MHLFSVGSKLPPNYQCIPFVSKYSDCTDANACSGCMSCSCSAEAEWSCRTVYDCTNSDENQVGDRQLDAALLELENQLDVMKKTDKYNYRPALKKPRTKDDFLDETQEEKLESDERNVETEIFKFLSRRKRSANEFRNDSTNDHELNESHKEFVKKLNSTESVQAPRLELNSNTLPNRRSGKSDANLNSLHIEYNHPQTHTHPVTDNKENNAQHSADHLDKLTRDKLNSITKNQSQSNIDKDLSKLVVNEMKKGSEVLGDKNAPVISNITFTPENDTLTATAIIAGNLLNKLWSMEKDASEESIEKEVLKHEKIADLLDLFKEPLTLTQEKFLKSALEKLSEAVDKEDDINSVSLCKNVEEVKQETQNKTNDKCDQNKTDAEKESHDSSEISPKLKNVQVLVKKLGDVQKKLDEIKQQVSYNKDSNIGRSKQIQDSKNLNSINKFKKILEKLTTFLTPNAKQKKRLLTSIDEQNWLGDNQDVADKIKEMYDIDIDSNSLTTKDKLVLDYLLSIEKFPECLLKNKHYFEPSPKVGGDLMNNLSEFLKIKSFSDLLKLIKSEKVTETTTAAATTTTTVLTSPSRRENTNVSSQNLADSSLVDTKEKLKVHLKSIIEDLTELQKARGEKSDNISIATLLPCVYNMINDESDNDVDKKDNLLNGVKKMFTMIKDEAHSGLTRRVQVNTPTTKAAEVWERIVQNLNDLGQVKTRRSQTNEEPISESALQQLIKGVQKSSTDAQYSLEVADPTERIMLLKILDMDVKRYISVLEKVNEFVRTNHFSDRRSLGRLLKSAITNINTTKSALTNLETNDLSNSRRQIVQSPTKSNVYNLNSPSQDMSLPTNIGNKLKELSGSNLRVNRDDIINQLIRNKVELYMRLKESKNLDLDNDSNYNVAKRIVAYLNEGNYILARELYKILTIQSATRRHGTRAEKMFENDPHILGRFTDQNLQGHHVARSESEPFVSNQDLFKRK